MATMTRVEVVVAQQLWVGVDAGKSDHHCVAIDADGNRLLSQRVSNDENLLLELIAAVTTLAASFSQVRG